MNDRVKTITGYLTSIPGVRILRDLTLAKYDSIEGRVSIEFENRSLDFDVVIQSSYPFQLHEAESIRFINPELIEYNHVNRDGSVCLHTAHHQHLKTKLEYDIESLKKWIVKYYVNKEEDSHYPHIVAQPSTINNHRHYFLFTDLNGNFNKGDYGKFSYSTMASGPGTTIGVDILTFIVKAFYNEKKAFGAQSKLLCNWTETYYNGLKDSNTGIFVYVDVPPTIHRRFIIENWHQLEPFVDQDFKKYLNDFKHQTSKKKEVWFPLFIGYKIPDGSTHWQAAMLSPNSIPVISEKLPDKKGYKGYFNNTTIEWIFTKNVSYANFFGRGKLHDEITEKKILIVGVGAIGSIVATTLARGGCRYLTLEDYDLKEPENVCRSEYIFQSGVRLKVNELALSLSSISPFVDVKYSSHLPDLVKLIGQNDQSKEKLKDFYGSYDLIIDCSADNDVLSMLDLLDLDLSIVSMSITNKAESLIFGYGRNIYKWVTEVSESLKGDAADLYEPIGCWSPTFRASYNDVNVLVQYAIKQFNLYMVDGKTPRSFYLTTETDQGFTIKLHEF